MTSLFAIIEFEKDPIQFNRFGRYLVSWLQDAGGFAAVGLALWVIYVLATPQPNVVGSRRQLISRFMAITGLLALVFYVVAAGLLFVGMARNSEVANIDQQPQTLAPVDDSKLERWQAYAITLGGFFALLAFCEPFFLDIARWRWRRIYAIAKLSFKEAIRRKIVWVFLLLLLVVLFPASWFIKQKPEDRVKLIVNVTYFVMTVMFVATSLLLAAFSIPTDVKNQTIHTIVTKPVERFEIAAGRFLGYITLVTIALVVETCVSLLLIETTNIEDAAKEESMKARSPSYGYLYFTKNNRPDEGKGIDVGREYRYRRYIPGGQGTPYKGEWNFTDLNGLSTSGDSIPCEFAFDVYRTIKGKEDVGVRCQFEFKSWRWDPKRFNEYSEATNKMFGKDTSWKTFLYEGDEKSSEAQKERWKQISQLAEEFGYYVVHNFQVEDYHTKTIRIPTGLIRNAKEGTPVRETTFFYSPNQSNLARLNVSVRCEDGGQFIGMNGYDLYLLESDGSFEVNFFKGAIGLWCRLCIAIALAIAASTYLAGVVSLLLALFLYLAGSFLEFIQELAQGTNVGGGPLESITRLVRGDLTSAPLDSTPTLQVVFFADGAFRWLLRRVYNVIPDTDRFSWVNYVAQGFNIRFDFLALNLIFLAAYLLPWFVLAYYLMRSREVAA